MTKLINGLTSSVPHHDLFPQAEFDQPRRSPHSEKSPPLEITKLYRAMALDPKLAHFVHIPNRIVRCLEHFGIAFQFPRVIAGLRSYYLFIGVVDDAIDSGQFGIGHEVLARLSRRVTCFDGETRTSPAHLATEMLKRDISDEVYPEVLTKLSELHQAVGRERRTQSMSAYIEERKLVGSLTAELSYLLIRPYLIGNNEPFCRLMKSVGAVGCLVDSVLDLSADADRSLLSFKPTAGSFLRLLAATLRDGIIVSLRHPSLVRLFLEGIVDNVKDRFRSDRSGPPRVLISEREEQAPSVV